MNRKRFSVEQITAILKQAELGTPIADLAAPARCLRTELRPMEEAVRRYGAL